MKRYILRRNGKGPAPQDAIDRVCAVAEVLDVTPRMMLVEGGQRLLDEVHTLRLWTIEEEREIAGPRPLRAEVKPVKNEGLSVVDRLQNAFKWVESKDLRVGDIWLNPKQVAELKGHPLFDQIASRTMREYFIQSKGAPYVAAFLGARVFESSLVPENHVALVPDGLDATLTDSAACQPF